MPPRTLATGLLILMAAATIAAHALPTTPWSELLRAAATAGLVGGLADWFAVTALFRHPLGLPIPHTAILPRQKARLGAALGRFLANHVMTEAEIARAMAGLDLASLLSTYLTDPATMRPAAQALGGMLPRLLASVEDGRARRTLGRILPRLMGGEAAGRVVARALRGLVEGGRHQDVLGFLITQIRRMLAAEQTRLRRVIEERVREQGGRLVGWALGASIATRVLSSMNAELDKMGPDNSELRAAFDEWMRAEIIRMESEPERAAEIGRAIRGVLVHETVQAWVWDIWARLRASVEADAARPRGQTQAILEAALGNLGRILAADPEARARVQSAGERLAAGMLPSAQAQLAPFIADIIARWEPAMLVQRLEASVGRDLQYVRVNGTLVGFLAGGAVHLLVRLFFDS